jgi:hypothetical protein
MMVIVTLVTDRPAPVKNSPKQTIAKELDIANMAEPRVVVPQVINNACFLPILSIICEKKKNPNKVPR